ncbi:MAG: glycogen synthase, partial [Firmicutes bacterium]|nr:glycogen synthase [Bacillota bacterium]
FYAQIKTVFTIHNLRYQGVFSKSILGDILSLGWEHFNLDGIEFHDQVSFMKGGLNYSNALTAVSPTYAQEIQTAFYGAGLEGVLARRQSFLRGILNGLDYEQWNPQIDPHIPKNYTWRSIQRKEENKRQLQAELNLPQDPQIPVLGLVSRLAAQKGLDLLAHVLEEILDLNLQLIILGTGEKEYEDLFRNYSSRYPDKLSTQITFDNELAHKIYAASDLFLMPSLFEPCGLGQLIALRYGALPLVRETGGLKDTIKAYNEKTNEGNGFSFANYNAHELLFTIQRALKLYQTEKETSWKKMAVRAMRQDFSWAQSAQLYKDLYQQVLCR